MMTSSNGNVFRVTGHWCGEFIGPRWILHTKASDAELWRFFYLRLNKRLSKQSWGWWLETPLLPLWRKCNVIWYGLDIHFSNVKWVSLRLKSPTIRPFVQKLFQTNMNENIKALQYWPFVRGVYWWLVAQRIRFKMPRFTLRLTIQCYIYILSIGVNSKHWEWKMQLLKWNTVTALQLEYVIS